MEDIIKKLRDEFNRIKDSRQEGNLQHHIIINTFMKYYGYNMIDCVIGERTAKGFCDIYIPTIDNEGLTIEVKNGYEPLKVKEISQVHTYVSDQHQRFGILTNGREYVLLDFHIASTPKDDAATLKSYVVFWFDIFKTKGKGLTNLKYFKYLSFEYLYEKKSTHFFCDIARYREWKFEQGMKEESWLAYRSTLYTFFNLYSQNKIYKRKFESEGKQCYENLSIEDFNAFIKECKRNKDKSSKKTIENNFSHVYDMLHELNKHGRINNIILSESRMQNLVEYEQTKRKKEFSVVHIEDVQNAIELFRNGRNANRNIVAFLLTISLGLERSQLRELKWDSFDKTMKHIVIDQRKIEMCKLLQDYLFRLLDESKVKKIKSPYVLVTYHKKKYNQMSEWSINDIFDKLANISNDGRWKNYSPKYLRNCLILSLFEANYPLEEIIYITGIDIKNLPNYITTDMILNRKNIKIDWNQLYDGSLCKSVS